MRALSWFIVTFALIPCVGCACGGPMIPPDAAAADAVVDDATDAGDAQFASVAALQTLCVDLATAVWAAQARCAPGADEAFLAAIAGGQSCTHLAELASAVERGAVTVDAAAIQACLDAWRGPTCDPQAVNAMVNWVLGSGDIAAVLSSCPGAIRGHRARGDTCVDFGECEGDDVCLGGGNPDPFDPFTCGGVCGPRLRQGDSCDAAHPCADTLRCIALFGETNRTCQPNAAEGDGCAVDPDCKNPPYDPPQLYCDPGRHCRARVSLGASCGGAMGVRCDEVTSFCVVLDGASGACTGRGSIGAPCRAEREYAGECADGLHCAGASATALGSCAGPGASGAPCTGAADCASNLRCTSGACGPLAGVGEACVAIEHFYVFRGGHDEECDVGLWCQPNCVVAASCTDGTCRAQAFIGDTCDADHACVGSACVGGRCVAFLPAGAPCTDSTPCVTLACESGLCADPTCPAR
jgi:hypothetical protein